MTYTFDSVCVGPSHDSTVTYYYWLCLSSHLTTCRHIWQMCSSHDLQMLLTVFVSFHLMMTCRHFWQCLCSSISWPADTFNSVCVHPSHGLRHFWQCLCPSISWPANTFDSVFVHLMTCTLLTVCLHPSHDLQTLLTVFVSIHLVTCRHFWQCLCPSSSWPVYTFDNFCVHPAYDLQTFFVLQCFFMSIHLMTFRHFLRWALLSLDNTTFSFSIFYKLFPGYNLILMPLFCISEMLSTCGT